MTDRFEALGHALVRDAVKPAELAILRQQADRLAAESEAVNIRDPLALSPDFRQLCDSPTIRRCLAPELSPVRSILFNKTAAHNWPVAWHQDLTITLRERHEVPGYGPWSLKDGIVAVQPPPSLLEAMVTIRIHLDDCGSDNGPLMVLPGSHRQGRLSATAIDDQVANTQASLCTCAAGDLLLMKPLLLHASRRAEAPSNRRVLHLEFAPRDRLHPDLQWHAEDRHSPATSPC